MLLPLRCLAAAAVLIGALLSVATGVRAQPDEMQFEVFRRVASLGLEPYLPHVFANDDVLASIDSLQPGSILTLDFDGKGGIDATAWREDGARIVATGRLEGLPDPSAPPANVTIIVDADSDGLPDHVAAYKDTNGDGKSDVQELYELRSGELSPRGIGVRVGFDFDGGGLPLHTTTYAYSPPRDMWQSRFDGDVLFVAGRRDDATGVWASAYENPFCFYDDDGDGRADEALRFEGEDLRVTSIRWSFDVDRSPTSTGRPAYDFSITAVGSLRAPESQADSIRLLDGGTLRYVSWSKARNLVRSVRWRAALLVWNEDGRNTDATPGQPERERWEGVIGETFRGFPQIGGPACGLSNKRYELDADGSGRLQVYFSRVDGRIHLLGAEIGQFDIRLPGTPPLARTVTTSDADQDGYLDTWSWSSDPDHGSRSVVPSDPVPPSLPLDAIVLRRFWRDALRSSLEEACAAVAELGSRDLSMLAEDSRHWWIAARDSMARLGEGVPPCASGGAPRNMQAERLTLDAMLWEIGGGFRALGSDGSGEKPPPGRAR
jgi:hypothetical protein